MDKSIIDDEWYALESNKHLRIVESMLERQDDIVRKMDKLEIVTNSILHRIEQTEQRTHKENMAIIAALHELKTIREREINIMIRERIPFPFGMPTLQSSTPNRHATRHHFSNSKPV